MAGKQCECFMDRTIQNVHVNDLELDECWSFVRMKEKNKGPNEANNTEIGDQYTYIAQDRASRMVIAWHLGRRGQKNTDEFIEKVRSVTAVDDAAAVCAEISDSSASAYSSSLCRCSLRTESRVNSEAKR